MFTFNGVNFSNKIKVKKIERPILAPQQISSSNIQGREGSVFHRKTSSSYNITIDFFLKEEKGKSLRGQLRELAGLLNTDEPRKLIFHDETDKYIMAILSDETSFEEIVKNGEGSIKFYCADPFWYATKDDVFEVTSNESYVFEKQGTAKSYPIYTIEGNGSNIEITTNQTKMIAQCELKTGEKMIIDSPKLTAYIQNAEGNKKSILMHLDKLDFPVLGIGSNSVLIKAQTGTISKYKIECNSKWL